MAKARGRLTPTAPAIAGAVVYVVLVPASADLAAQTYRSDLFGRQGFALFDLGWFAGHHVPGYSLLFPPLGAAIGPPAAGALAAVAAAVLFTVLARDHWPRTGSLAAAWFALGTVSVLLSGRLTFALGLAVGLAALLALQRGRTAAAVVLALASGPASPVAALFLAVAAGAVVLAVPGRRGAAAAVAAAALVPVALLALCFPEGGTEPFGLGTLWPQVLFGVGGAALLPRSERVLRAGLLLYAALCLAVWAIPSPVGANAARLGPLVAGPIAAGVLAARRPVLLAVLALPLLAWQWSAAVRDVSRAAGDPATEAAYYAPVLAFLRAHDDPPARVEIPPTADHWESARVPPAVPLARGWERQLDRRDDGLFYRPRLDPAAYRRWLDALAVRWVALPDAPLDHAGTTERRLLERGAPFLRPVWRSRHWRVWAVRRPAPLAAGPARVTGYGDDHVLLRFPRAGRSVVRVRWTRYWALGGEARGCVSEAAGGWTAVTARRAGLVVLKTSFALDRVRARGRRCR